MRTSIPRRATRAPSRWWSRPDYSEAAKFSDLWLHPEAGHGRGAGHGHGPRHPARVSRRPAGRVFRPTTPPQYTDMPMLVRLVEKDGRLVPERLLRAAISTAPLARPTIRNGRPSPSTKATGKLGGAATAPSASAGARRASGTSKERTASRTFEHQLRLSWPTTNDEMTVSVGFPLFRQPRARALRAPTDHDERARAQRAGQEAVKLADGEALVATVFDLFCRQLRRRPRLRRRQCRQELRRRRALHAGLGGAITGVPRDKIITVAREFATNAEKTNGPLHGHPRRRAQPLVPHGHELPRDHQSPGHVRLRRPVRRRLVALCRPGKAAPADRLAAARLRARLGRVRRAT